MHVNVILRYLALAALLVFAVAAAEHHGVVKFGAVPVPGATVTATQGDKKFVAVTDPQGAYSFPDLPDGTWSVQVEMLCFAPVKKEIGVAPDAPTAEWALKLLSMDEIKPESRPAAPATTAPAAGATPSAQAAAPAAAAAASAKAATPPAAAKGKKNNTKAGAAASAAGAQPGFQRTDVNATAPADANGGAGTADNPGAANLATADGSQGATDAMVVNGSASTGIERRAIGNFRKGPGSMFNGGLSFVVDNSVFDARQYSVTGQNIPKPYFNQLRPGVTFGGPLLIPHLLRGNGNFFVAYQGNRSRNASTQSGLMPTADERNGIFSGVLSPQGQPVVIYDPTTGQPFPFNQIPQFRISPQAQPQAQALLKLYPNPNFDPNARFNYEIPIVSRNSTDAVQGRINKTINNKNFLNGSFAYQNSRNQNPTLFGFLDKNDSSGMNAGITWRRMINRQSTGVFGFQFSRSTSHDLPFFANQVNVAGNAGITGNNQEPGNWGPPTLNFGSGISGLSDRFPSFTRNQTAAWNGSITWVRRPHNMTFGGDFRLQQFNLLSQSDPRGTFGFTGAATQNLVNGVAVPGTGFDFADFLLGIPDTSSIAFGNADKYLRASSADAYFTDDWRMNSTFTLNAGVRWEYNSPIYEKYGRMVNLDVTPGFTSIAQVVANNPSGALTGQRYPDSLVRPDKRGIEPRVSFAWHPFFGASTVVRGGYGVYYDTSVYMGIVQRMIQQSPLSKSLSVQNSPANPLTLANGFKAPPNTTTNTFAIDPNFRPGYSQNWQFSVQQNVTGSMVMTVTYLGIKGTHAVQAFLPQTYPAGASSPCPACPSGYAFMTSNGNSTKQAGQVNLRRRFHAGLSTSLQYTYSKALDDAALGGRGQVSSMIAQDWLHLNYERSLSNFDQRHQLNAQLQYTTGVGVHGGALLGGWRGVIFKGWTIVSNINVNSGLPLSPVFLAAAGRTGVTGTLRPEYTGGDVYAAPPGFHLNPLAYIAPLPGQWGNAGRNSIIGPNQFTMNASFQRSFDRVDVRFDATNPLNHVTFPDWGTTLNPQFGLPSRANPMRSMQATVRVRLF